MDNIRAIYSQYQQKHTCYNNEAIIDLMLDDGVIDFETARKLKTSPSLFLTDNVLFSSYPEVQEINPTEILGGHFNNTNATFNREVEPTKQPSTQGDCWLLSDINALSYTDWGKQALKEAIIPDEDGSGGVTIKFKGSPIEQKEFHYTKEQIIEARKSGNYAEGDDDVIALELATEQTYREMVKQGIATRATEDKGMIDHAKYRSFIWGGVKTEEFEQHPISELLGINVYVVDCLSVNNYSSADEDKERMLKWFSENKQNVVANCGFAFIFGGYGEENTKDYIHGGHAYAIKDIIPNEKVIITDPHYSDYDIEVPYDVFKDYVKNLNFSFKEARTESQFRTSGLPKNYEYKHKKAMEEYENTKLQQEKDLENWFKKQQEDREKYNDSIKLELQKWNKSFEKEQLKYEEERRQETLDMFEKAKAEDNIDELFYYDMDANLAITILDKHPDIIEWLDSKTNRLGSNGNKKSILIYPFIEALTKEAANIGIDNSIVTDFKTKCVKELNAIFYTNGKVIQNEVTEMVKLIKKQ